MFSLTLSSSVSFVARVAALLFAMVWLVGCATVVGVFVCVPSSLVALDAVLAGAGVFLAVRAGVSLALSLWSDLV